MKDFRMRSDVFRQQNIERCVRQGIKLAVTFRKLMEEKGYCGCGARLLTRDDCKVCPDCGMVKFREGIEP